MKIAISCPHASIVHVTWACPPQTKTKRKTTIFGFYDAESIQIQNKNNEFLAFQAKLLLPADINRELLELPGAPMGLAGPTGISRSCQKPPGAPRSFKDTKTIQTKKRKQRFFDFMMQKVYQNKTKTTKS